MSPVTIRKKNGYEVRTPGGIKSKGTSKKKAFAQKRLLDAIEHNPNWKPTGKPSGLAAMAENQVYQKKPKKKKRG